VRDLIERSAEDISGAAVRRGMVTLGDEGIRACVEGITSLEEIRRVMGDRLL
jgi:type II secretory ATPase GspE/PulE/Tfp pilus assembly ATPase PilB-like protein